MTAHLAHSFAKVRGHRPRLQPVNPQAKNQIKVEIGVIAKGGATEPAIPGATVGKVPGVSLVAGHQQYLWRVMLQDALLRTPSSHESVFRGNAFRIEERAANRNQVICVF
jgi:hypothetical protein